MGIPRHRANKTIDTKDIDSSALIAIGKSMRKKLGIECPETLTTEKNNYSGRGNPDDPDQPPRSPNSLAQSSNSFSPEAETLGRILTRLALKSVTSIGLISSGDMCSNFSPRERRGPMAASFARAVISLPEKPGTLSASIPKVLKTDRHTFSQIHQLVQVFVADVVFLRCHQRREL